ncbi:DEAD/DEAH box helicase [Halococcus sediminicola]|uniref:DEAD/DEAH box helicase n=1 Tax=Halococcus sediminicola TaxID=1264579 RepID=UPI000678C4D2|nr:DEAD/DEAH box helicase family protein [Halococcus sediminicola]
MVSLLPEYPFFIDYRDEMLSRLSSIEQLAVLDDEIANKAVLSRYQGPVDSFEWRYLESHYDDLFVKFLLDRITGIVDTTPVETHKRDFHQFRHGIARLNRHLPTQRSVTTTTLAKPAERILLKRLRQSGFNPDDLSLSYIERGGGLYLLELFVSAAQQQALHRGPLLTTLLNEASTLGEGNQDSVSELLNYPVLMVTPWKNQRDGLNRWLENDQKGILEMATATGKTVAGIAAIAYLCGDLPEHPDQEPATNDAKILVVAHSNAILKQWEREIQEKLGLPMPERTDADLPDKLHFATGKVEFYTAQSLLPRYDRDLEDEYDLVIYDEVHHYSNVKGFGKAITRPNYKAAIGLSATIGDEDGPKRRQLEQVLAPVVYTYGLQEALADSIIPEFEWTVHPTALDPHERSEWQKTTDSITNTFRAIKASPETRRALERLSVPFTEMRDLGDFIQAFQAAGIERNGNVPDSWERLQAAIQSRNWIRHRSRPKLDDAIRLAKDYLIDSDQQVKLVIFSMDIASANRIAEELREISDNVFLAHSKLASSSKKNTKLVQQNIDGFAKAQNGVLVSPRLLDEGIDVPDAEVGINVAGTKTQLQLVQRMGRILRKHGDKKPHFHHYISVPDEEYLEGLDSKEYAQELNWVRELGTKIGQQPIIDDATVNPDVIHHAEQRGNELWAQDLLNDIGVETVQGTIHLDQVLEDLTGPAAGTIRSHLEIDDNELSRDTWQATMEELREQDLLPVPVLQRVWWLFPLYRERPSELDELLVEVVRVKGDDRKTSTATTSEQESAIEDEKDVEADQDLNESEPLESAQQSGPPDVGQQDTIRANGSNGKSDDKCVSHGQSKKCDDPEGKGEINAEPKSPQQPISITDTSRSSNRYSDKTRRRETPAIENKDSNLQGTARLSEFEWQQSEGLLAKLWKRIRGR